MNNKIVVILLLLITAGIAFAAEDWNLGTVQTFWNVDIKGGNISANGSGLTNINVSNATGTLANERLPANITGKTNITSKQIGGVIYADQYATIQDAINASSDGGIIQLPSGIIELNKTYIMPSGTSRKAVLLCGMTSTGAKNGIILKGMGINATTLKWSGVSSNIIMIGSCYDGNSIPGHPFSQDITISDMTIDGNNAAHYGIIIEKTNGFRIENVRIKNLNRSDPAGFMCGIGIYAKNGVVRNIHIDPSIVSNYSLISDPSLIAGILFDSTDTSNVFVDNVFMDGGGGTGYLSGFGMEDYPSNFHVSNFNIQNINGTAISSSASDGIGDFSFSHGNISNVKVIANLKNSNNVLISDIHATNITHTGGDAMLILLQNSTIQNIYIDNLNNKNIFMNAVLQLSSASNNFISNINIKNTKVNHAVISLIGASVNNKIVGGNIINNSNVGIWIDPNNEGLSDNNTISGFTVAKQGARGFAVGASKRNIIINNIEYNNGDIDYISVNNIFYNNYGASPYYFGNNATFPTAFGAGDSVYNSTANIQQLYTGSAWDWFLMPSKVFGTGVTNNNNGSITISSILSQCPTSLVNGSMCLNHTTGAQNNYFNGLWRYTNGTIIT